MKKKVLLVTLWGNRNLGNKLQNYALQSLLEDSGFDVYTAVLPEPFELNIILKNGIKIFLSYLGMKKYISYKYEKVRQKKLKEFSDFYIKHKLFINSYKSVKGMDFSAFDYGVTGSDQVWHNWYGTSEELEYFYLTFLPKEKRISFSASFGFDKFPEEDILLHKKMLKEMKAISCREKSGCRIIHKLTNRDAVFIPDPTLCVKKSLWIKLQKRPKEFKNKQYILLYFLGDITGDYWESINKLALKLNLPIINLMDINVKEFYLITPDEFVWMISHASFVCTDSFHAVAFSIIFEIPFSAFHRKQNQMEGMFDRIRNLLNLTQLERCEYRGYCDDTVTEKQKREALDKISVYNSIAISYIQHELC